MTYQNLDVFLAKNDSDWQVRMDSLEKITDEYVLKDIFQSDEVINVRIKAMGQIKDTDFLVDECLNNPNSHIRLAILNRICDELLLDDNDLSLLLEKILLNDQDSYVLKTAFEKADNVRQDVLVQVLNSRDDEIIQREAVKRLTSENLLTDYALNNPNDYIRLEAIQNPNLGSIKTIHKIIATDENEFNRLMAIYKINYCESLAGIVYHKDVYPYLSEIAQNITFPTNDYFLNDFKNSGDEYKRQVDVLFIEDENFLQDIVFSENDELKALAIKNTKFNNQEILETLIKTESSERVLLEVVSKIDNQEMLIDYIKNNLKNDVVTVKAVSKVNDLEFLDELSTNDDSKIRLEAVNRIINLTDNDELLKKIALTDDVEEICIKAISSMNIRNDLIEVADFRSEKNIRLMALEKIKAKPLLYNFTHPVRNSIDDLPYEAKLKETALNDEDAEIRCIATSKLNDELVLREIASSNDVTSNEAQNRLNSLFEDIKSLDSVYVLDNLAKCSDREVSRIAQETLDDLYTWKRRISKINEIDEINELKDIANNDFNYFVRNEAEGKLENILFNIRLDEIENDENQEKLKAIVCDDTFPNEIRKKAFLKITDDDFIQNFRQV